ncbi:B12-binding domain-containing radical SAM protein [Mariprofundus ferrinatatus]|nr:radical SAM protein [Mariprofundus ferrinatatus]
MEEMLDGKARDVPIYISYPLGVMTLAAWCKQELPHHDLQILDLMMELHKAVKRDRIHGTTIEEFISMKLDAVGCAPDFIGLSLNFSNGHSITLKVAEMCKARWPETKIIVGGMHATTFSSHIIVNDSIDFLIRGPGDLSFPQLLTCLENGDDISSVPGIVTGLHNIMNMGQVLYDLDRIPRYPYELLDMDYLMAHESTAPIKKEGARIATIFMSRGCPYPCTYCSASKVHGKKIYFNSIAYMMREIEYLINEYGVNQINIVDDLFGSNKEYFFDFFKEVKRKELKFDLSVPAGLAVSVFNEEMIDTLVDHGLEAVTIPLESGSKYVQQKIIKKRVDIEKALRLLDFTRSRGVFTGVNIVIGSPGETRELMDETFEFLRTAPVDWITFFIAYPYPGTTMTDVLIEKGEISEEKLIEVWDSSTQGFRERPFDTEEISGKELFELVYDYNIKLNFFHNYNIEHGHYDTIVPKLDKIVNNHPWHIVAVACIAKCYHELGMDDLAQEYVNRIPKLVATESLSKQMFETYRQNIEGMIESFAVLPSWSSH